MGKIPDIFKKISSSKILVIATVVLILSVFILTNLVLASQVDEDNPNNFKLENGEYLDTNKNNYLRGEPVTIKFKNDGTCGGVPISAGFRIISLNDGEVIFKACPIMLQMLPGQNATNLRVWDQIKDIWGKENITKEQVLPGKYQVRWNGYQANFMILKIKSSWVTTGSISSMVISGGIIGIAVYIRKEQ